MDPTSGGIAATVVSVLLPLINSGSTEFAKRVGAGTFDAAKKLMSALKQRFSQDSELQEEWMRFEARPHAQRDQLECSLNTLLANDPAVRGSLISLLEPLTASIHIIQTIGVADRVTGIAADEMTEGTLVVDMQVDEAKDVIGAHVKRIGR